MARHRQCVWLSPSPVYSFCAGDLLHPSSIHHQQIGQLERATEYDTVEAQFLTEGDLQHPATKEETCSLCNAANAGLQNGRDSPERPLKSSFPGKGLRHGAPCSPKSPSHRDNGTAPGVLPDTEGSFGASDGERPSARCNSDSLSDFLMKRFKDSVRFHQSNYADQNVTPGMLATTDK